MNLTQSGRGKASGSFILAAGLLFLLMPVLSFCLCSLGFIAGLSITSAHFPVMVLITVGAAFYTVKRVEGEVGIRYFLAACLLFAVISTWGILHLNGVYDTSYDGIWYHQEAVINLYRGWNPYYRTLVREDGSEFGSFYVNHYPKAAWIAESVVYAFTHKIQAAKVVQVWFAAGLLFTTLYMLLLFKSLPLWFCIIVSILVGLNPVSVYQLYSFYVDGILGACLMLMIVLLIARVISARNIFTILALLVFMFAANIKFTGLVYGVVILGFYFIYLVWKKQKLLYDFSIMFIAGISAVVILGYPTYVTNTISNKHPFFPIMGPESFGDVIAAIPQPANFKDKNRFEKFGMALFADPIWCRAPLETRPKHLFGPLPSLHYFARPDFEISGLGPFQAELFILFIPAFLALLVLKIPGKKELLFLLLVLFGSTFINSEVWYARYAPHLWLLGIILVLALYQHKYARYASFVLLAALFFNIFMLGNIYIRTNILNSVEARRQINTLKKLERPVSIANSWQSTFETMANEAGLSYHYVNLDSTYNAAEYSPFAGFNIETAKFKISELEEARQLP